MAIGTETDWVAASDFIEIPVWDASGVVMAVEPAWMGDDQERRVLVSAHPEDEDGRWYSVGPDSVVVS